MWREEKLLEESGSYLIEPYIPYIPYSYLIEQFIAFHQPLFAN